MQSTGVSFVFLSFIILFLILLASHILHFVIFSLGSKPTAFMDPRKNDMVFSFNTELAKENLPNTSLQSGSLGFGGIENSEFGSKCTNARSFAACSNIPGDGCTLVLGLGPTPSSYPQFPYPVDDKKKGSMAVSDRRLASENDSILKLCLSGCSEDVSNIAECSGSAESNIDASQHSDHLMFCGNIISLPIADEGSTSAKKSGGYLTTFFIEPRSEFTQAFQLREEQFEQDAKSHSQSCQLGSEPSYLSDYSRSSISVSATAVTSADRRISNPKRCKFSGCNKGARGATGFCIGHGGGQRCQKPGCTKGAESRTAYCKAHGGGKRCNQLGCTKSAEGKTEHCIAHGGGRRCVYPSGCSKAARGKSGLCIKHGGGKRCKVDGCTRSAEGRVGLCISHGGGRRCQFQNCLKGAQGSTVFCKAHGGGKRCIFVGCTKGAEGSTPLCKGHGGGKRCLYEGGGICSKSVHGGTSFCVAHGGGKRCAIPGCTKSARGRTDCCVRHGGGKRCRIESCGKSAQGSTDFCKAHGGGKRCNWGGGICEKFARGKSGLCAAHSSLVLRQDAKKVSLIGPGLFHDLVSAPSNSGLQNSSSPRESSISESMDFVDKVDKQTHLVTTQASVHESMRASSSCLRPLDNEYATYGDGIGSLKTNLSLMIPEGRVHGGGLLSLFGGNVKNAVKEI